MNKTAVLTLLAVVLAGPSLPQPSMAQTPLPQAQGEEDPARSHQSDTTSDTWSSETPATTSNEARDEQRPTTSGDTTQQSTTTEEMQQAPTTSGEAMDQTPTTSGYQTTTSGESMQQPPTTSGEAAQEPTTSGMAAPAAPPMQAPSVVLPQASTALGASVTVTSIPGDSISSNYHVDFDAMDTNGDGNITRTEARGNEDLMREFHVADTNNNGRLTREEMKGWLD